MKKEKLNEIKVNFPALSSNEGLSRIIVTGFLMPFSPTVEELADLKTAVSEAVTNAIVHAYRSDTAGRVALSAKITSDGVVSITVSDKGCGIEDIHKAMEPLFTTDRENERSGMGFSIMESFSDNLKVTSKPGKGTKIVMTKRLSEFKR